ncbi:hypothetical protein V6N13_058544 [Hibiscus sabdariffa]
MTFKACSQPTCGCARTVWFLDQNRNRRFVTIMLLGLHMLDEFRMATAPPIHWCKVNVDGVCDPGTGMASCGGAIRNDLR